MGTSTTKGTLPRAVLLLLALSLGACATTSESGSGASSDVVTGEELVASRHVNVLSALQNLRPTWVRGRGARSMTSASEVTVFLDGRPYGTAVDLQSIPVDVVLDVQFLSASAAGARYGTPAGNSGLILVRTSS